MFQAAFPLVPENSLAVRRSDSTGRKMHRGAKREVGEHKGQTTFLVIYFLHNTWQIFVYHQE